MTAKGGKFGDGGTEQKELMDMGNSVVITGGGRRV